MKTYHKIVLAGLLQTIGWNALAQVQVKEKDVQDVLTKTIPLQKTLTGWDILGNLYQLSLNDISADDKSVKFKSTIFGLNHLDGKPVTSDVYKSEHGSRHVELFTTFGYKGQFDPGNLTAGATFSLINLNDATESTKLQTLPAAVKNTQQKLSDAVDVLIAKLTPDMSQATADQRNAKTAQLKGFYSALNAFVKSGDPTDAPAAIKSLLDSLEITDCVIALHSQMADLSQDIANGFNLSLVPQATYAFNQSGVQGASLTFNGIIGVRGLFKNTLQFTGKAGYDMGDDTIIQRSAIGRHKIATQWGLNHVLFTKMLKADDGTQAKGPAAELAVAYGWNYLTRGYADSDTRKQETLSAKLGFLIGKDSWILMPFIYNFATKEKMASITVKVNLGSAPFK